MSGATHRLSLARTDAIAGVRRTAQGGQMCDSVICTFGVNGAG